MAGITVNGHSRNPAKVSRRTPSGGEPAARPSPPPQDQVKLSRDAAATPKTTPNFQSWAAQGQHQLPPGSYDAGTISKEQLNGLLKSKDPKQQALGQTIQRARKNYAELIEGGSRIIANRNEGNGGSPVLTVLPPGFDPNKETRVHTHYHGFNSTVADPKGHAAQTTERLAELQKKQPQTVVVLPETSNAQDGAYSTQWTNVKNQADTTNQALRDAGVTNPTYRVVSAHSAGGEALRKSIANVPGGAGLQADRLELLDSLYGSENAIANWAKTDSGRDLKALHYVHGTNDHSDAGLRAAFGNRYHRTNVKGHYQANHLMDTFPDSN
jgi:hypothetical protein